MSRSQGYDLGIPSRLRLVLLFALALAGLWIAPTGSAAPPLVTWCGGTDHTAANRVPDLDVSSPYQIHVVYATPADGPDNFALDASLIATDVAAIDAWWQGQDPTRTPRFDLYPFPGCSSRFGQLDISFARLQSPGSAYLGDDRTTKLSNELAAVAGDTVKTLVYYDGPAANSDVCGTSAYVAPQNGGPYGFAFVWLNACSPDLGQGGQTARVAAHELLHDLGAEPDTGPPNACTDPANAGHPCDSPTDILYPIVQPGASLASAELDVGRNDYYGHSGTWWDVQDSEWLSHLPQHTLTVFVAGSGGTVISDPKALSCPSACTMTIDNGLRIGLAANPAAGHRFVRWSGACSGSDVCSVTMDGEKSVTAQFGPASYRLVVSVQGHGRVAGAGISCPGRCSGSVGAGGKAHLKATPAAGYRFAGWSGDCRGGGACTLRGDRDRAVSARFVRR